MSTRGDDELSQRLSDQSASIEESDTPIHRAGEGEGVRAPLAQDGADHAEFSVFDGKGNEQVVVVTDGADGGPVQATGASSEEAMGTIDKLKTKLGDAFGAAPHKK